MSHPCMEPQVMNADWTREELILALELFLRGEEARKSARELDALSATLNALSIHPVDKRSSPFRDPDGVRRRLSYFAQIAEGQQVPGHSEYHDVWLAYRDDPAALGHEAARIKRKYL